MTYEWARLVLAAVGVAPPLAFVLLAGPTRHPLRALPAWVTWVQSLALVLLYGGVIGASVEALAWRRFVPSPGPQVLLFGGYGGVGAVRWLLLWWWWRDRHPTDEREG